MKKILLSLLILSNFCFSQSTITPGKNGGTGIANTGKTITLGSSINWPTDGIGFLKNNGSGTLTYGYPTLAQVMTSGSNVDATGIIFNNVGEKRIGVTSAILYDYSENPSLDWNGLALFGNWTGVTQSPGNNSTRLATTAFVAAAIGSDALTNGYIFIGNGSNFATGVLPTLSASPGTFTLSNTGIFTFPNATTSLRGLITSADWNTFNNKQAALIFSTPLSATSNTVSIKYGTGLSVSGGSLIATPTTPTLTSTYIGYGNGSNQLTGAANFTFDGTDLTLQQGGSSYSQLGTVGPISYLGDYLNMGDNVYISTDQSSDNITFNGSPLNGSFVFSGHSNFNIGGLQYMFPTSQSANTVLKNDGSGNLTWGTVPNSGLANSTFTINGTGMALGTSSTVTAAAGTLTGTGLNSTVVTSSLTTAGTFTAGGWQATKISEAYGGTNQSSYTTGDILYASASNTLSKLSDVAAGSFLRSGGTSTAPAWSTLVMSNSATSGQVSYASATNTQGFASNLTLDNTNKRLQIGAGTPTFNAGVTIYNDANTFGFVHQQTNTALYTGFAFLESVSHYAQYLKGGSTVAGNLTGSSLPAALAVQITNGPSFTEPVYILASPVVITNGSTATNMGQRTDAVGVRIDQMQNLHTAPNYALDIANGNVGIATAGKTLRYKTGVSNCSAGTGTLSGGTLVISTTAVTANSLIFITDTGGGVLANIGALYISARTGGTSFTVSSSNALDTSTFNWFIVEPY